ncbi:MAG: glycoside hydrolase family 3 C-terminal domain-containing protein [Micropruina sp.]|uniref:glycoside hydrolase family 3 C-terminal domain-containing protein n=1 Tax=Micropruina sp. TaxID=2737536 RepID=UPI0039E49A1A
MSDDRIPDVSELSLEEKASLTSGLNFWHTTAVERVGVPSLMLTDGPHGLRKQTGSADHLGLAGSVPATCFPPAVGLASSLDPELAERVGEALGTEAAIENVAVLLGPGINIKRSPLCGRNFEYMSEDPIVSGEMGLGLVKGIQSKGVGSSLKHFAANNQESDRMRSSSDVDPRPLHEIYLRAFERVVKGGQPWTVMTSYNKINGVWASQDPWLLTEVLRDDWGFEGLVVSDWGAVVDRIEGVRAGMDLEMPGCDGRTDADIVEAARSGALDEAALDAVVRRNLDLVRKALSRPAIDGPLDAAAHHALAREVAARCIVLLKNDGVLPLRRDAKLAVIGEFAEKPRYQGAGSSQIVPTKLDVALDEIRALADGAVSYAPGFAIDGSGDAAELRAQAVAAAADAEVAVLFLGVPAAEESEGFDRTHIDLPAVQLELLDAVLAVNPNVVVVLSNGGVVDLPFVDKVPALLEGWLLGQAGGGATADILFGVANPSARLAETIPLRLEDNPSYGNFPGDQGRVRYGEGLLVGYRWYDERKLDVRFPFGHGLSYTTFEYGDAAARVTESGDVLVTVPVTNTGAVAGREVVQAYVSLPGSAVQRAPRELKGFRSVLVEAGQTVDVEVLLRHEDLAYWDLRVDRWVVEPGRYTVEVGASSRDLRSQTAFELAGEVVRTPITLNSTFGELMDDPIVGEETRALVSEGVGGDAGALVLVTDLPVGRLDGFPLPRSVSVGLVEKAQRG